MAKNEKNAPGESPTGHMMGQLRMEKDFERFVNRYQEHFLDENISRLLGQYMERYGMDKNEVIARADIERGYAYQILRGKREASRDKLIRLAFAIGLSVDEAQRLLTIARKGMLYPKIKRDAAILFCLEKGRSLLETSAFLYDMGLPPLD